jgi:hypothetical protein
MCGRGQETLSTRREETSRFRPTEACRSLTYVLDQLYLGRSGPLDDRE